LFEIIFDPNNYPFWILIIAIIAGAIAIISRPFSTYIKFVYPNAKFEAMGNPFIEEKELSSVLQSKDLSGFKDTLDSLKDYNIKGETTYDVQQSLDDHFIKTIDMMRKDSSKKMQEFYDVYLEKLDIYLIKRELKRKLSGISIESSSVDQALLPNTKTLLEAMNDVEQEELPALLKSYGFSKELTNALTEETVDFLAIDTSIDTYLIDRFKQITVPYKCEQGKQTFIKRMLDIINIKTLLRAKQLGYDLDSCKKLFLGEGQEFASWKFNELADVNDVSQVISGLEGTSYYGVLKDAIEDYTKEESVQVLENALDGLFLKLVKDISIQNYINIGPTIRFIVSKEFEIQNLKIVAKGIGENLSSDLIKTFLITEAST